MIVIALTIMTIWVVTMYILIRMRIVVMVLKNDGSEARIW